MPFLNKSDKASFSKQDKRLTLKVLMGEACMALGLFLRWLGLPFGNSFLCVSL